MFRLLDAVCGFKLLLLLCKCFKHRNTRRAHVIKYTYITLHTCILTLILCNMHTNYAWIYVIRILHSYTCVCMHIYILSACEFACPLKNPSDPVRASEEYSIPGSSTYMCLNSSSSRIILELLRSKRDATKPQGRLEGG